MGTKANSSLPRQERRVAAWIYVVINPIVEALARELDLLERGNLTWRFTTKKCEYVRTIQEYVDSRQWPNFKDFLVENGLFQKTFSEHDKDLDSLNVKAGSVYDWLVNWDQFSVTLRGLVGTYESQRTGAGQAWPSYEQVRQELAAEAAQYVINNVDVLPSHYTYSFFWNFASRQLLQFRGLPEFRPILSAQAQLKEISLALRDGLEEYRLMLSRKHDVPAAPVPGISFDW
jgi:hypothetical protein